MRDEIFINPESSKELFSTSSTNVTSVENKNTRLKNAFYDLPQINEKFEAIILDGPHGNGRSMCFPLLKKCLLKGTIILIDDYDHYPFLSDLEKISSFKIIEEKKYKHSNKAWILVMLENIKQ